MAEEWEYITEHEGNSILEVSLWCHKEIGCQARKDLSPTIHICDILLKQKNKINKKKILNLNLIKKVPTL